MKSRIILLLFAISLLFAGCQAGDETVVASSPKQPVTNANSAIKTESGISHSDNSRNQKSTDDQTISFKKTPKFIQELLRELLDTVKPDQVTVSIQRKDLNLDKDSEYIISVVNDGESVIKKENRPVYIITRNSQNKDIFELITNNAINSNGLKYIDNSNPDNFLDIQVIRAGTKLNQSGEPTSEATEYLDTFAFNGKYYWCKREELKTNKEVSTKLFQQDYSNDGPPEGINCPVKK